jgi:hypothetical protein
MNWTALLDPANGGPGESPGYRETLAAIRAKPYVPKGQRSIDKSSTPCASLRSTQSTEQSWPRPSRLRSSKDAASL